MERRVGLRELTKEQTRSPLVTVTPRLSAGRRCSTTIVDEITAGSEN
ncbi:hypothetical protein [Protofrankia symbiont of Coriaria ruscifolia]|nr:hypothetical protein [Protofrankia symbiont of Coriaria ruscifolia]